MDYRLISVADFLVEPRDLYESHLPQHLRGHSPHVVKHPDGGEGWSWTAEPPEQAFGWGEGQPRWAFSQLPASAVDPAAHLEAMDAAGIDAAVVFPMALLDGIGRLGPEMRRTVAHAYNEWVGEAVEGLASQRLVAPRLLPIDAPWAAARELAAQLDEAARAVIISALPPPDDEEWQAVLFEAAHASLMVCLIDTQGSRPEIDAWLSRCPSLRVAVIPFSAIETAPSPVAWLFDRHNPDGAAMYCAGLPRRLVDPPRRTEERVTTALEAFRFFDRPRREGEAAVRVRQRIAIPSSNAMATSGARLPNIGISLSNVVDDGPLRAESIVASARYLEEAGFAGLWMGDVVARFTHSHPLDPLVALAVAAGGTSRIELGTAVLQVPLRRRVELAHRILSLHELVPGRFTLGVGAGSTQVDFDAVGVPFASRFRELREAVPEMRALWQGECVGQASFYTTTESRGGPPVLLGSWGGQWVERAAREFDGWIASGTRTWRTLADAITRFRAAGGKRAVLGTVFADVSAEGEPMDDDDRVHLVCSPTEAIRRLGRLAEMGFTDVIIFNRGPKETLPDLAALARGGAS